MEKGNGQKRVALVLPVAAPVSSVSHSAPLGAGDEVTVAGTGANRCYLCRRTDGDKGVALQNDPEVPVAITTVTLGRYRVNVLDRFALDYLLCFECATLIQAFEVSRRRSRTRFDHGLPTRSGGHSRPVVRHVRNNNERTR